MSLKTTPTPDDKNPVDPEIVHADDPNPPNKLGCPQEETKPEKTRAEKAEELKPKLAALLQDAKDRLNASDTKRAYFLLQEAWSIECQIKELERFKTDEELRSWLLTQVENGYR